MRHHSSIVSAHVMTKAAKAISEKAFDFNILLKPLSQEGPRWDALTLDEALTSLEDGFPAQPPIDVVAHILHACRKQRNHESSMRLSAYLLKRGMETHPSLGNYLVSLLSELGSIAFAQKIFDTLLYQSSASWNSLMARYLKCGMPHHAFALYERMQGNSTQPTAVNFVGLLKVCAQLKDVEKGCRLHTHITQMKLLEKDPFLGSILVDMYAKCGAIPKAQEVFDELPSRGVVAWTALIAGYVKHGCCEEALKCYEQMLFEDLSPDAITFTCSLKACGNLGATEMGQEIHFEIARRGLLESDHLIGSSLVDMYANCGLLAKADEVFETLAVRDVVAWTTLITGCIKHGFHEKALVYFERMQHAGIPPNSVTYACSLKACACIGAIQKGEEIHEEILKKGVLETDQLVGNALVDMYAKFNLLVQARDVFDKLLLRDVVSWNALITGYVNHGLDKEALMSYEQMLTDGISPDVVTFVCCLKACGSLNAVVMGQHLHSEIFRRGSLLESDRVGNALVDMYMRCGLLVRAEEVFEELLNRDVVSWNLLISAYLKRGYSEEALLCFDQMEIDGIVPNAVTFVCCLKACANIGVLEKGEHIHAEISKEGFLVGEISIGNTLVDMYAKCGVLPKAQEVFDKLPNRDVVSWTSLIAGYGQVGELENAVRIFHRMEGEGTEPNSVTFVSVLNACSHAGYVEAGEVCLEAMKMEYGIYPTLEHYTCMVDLLSRAGQVHKAVAMIKEIPFHPDLVVWHTMLGAYQKWGNVKLGRRAFEHALRLDEKDPATYIFMSNLYGDYNI